MMKSAGLATTTAPAAVVSRLTRQEMLEERTARLAVLQAEDEKWTAGQADATRELAFLEYETEAMESIELVLARSEAEVEAESEYKTIVF